ncbi:MAG: zinc-ribbon domain-containing protein [Deltaproteobacteria bacterium]|nr:zinc-ribbon domain-containing protein [Deltaproteobacteria bacterium]
MLCSKCGTDNPETAKFCIECASSLARRCPSCGAENPPHAKFCAQCATRLSGSVSPRSSSALRVPPRQNIEVNLALDEGETNGSLDGERKTVTALFADIKGSMELMEDLDPDEARAFVDPALKLMIDAVHRYGGFVVQSTGDGIFALFGAPTAHEDHPQHALYAALRLQQEMRRYSARLREAGNLPVEARVGVNTGEVVVRSIATSDKHPEYTPIGHSTSLAARMQALAPTGSIAATDATRKLCEGYFTFRALGPTHVKGVSEPVEVFEVTGVGPLRTRLQAAMRRGLTKFIGEIDEPTFRRAVSQEPEERLQRCRCDLRSGRTPLDAVCAGQERSPAGRTSAASHPLPAHQVAHGTRQRNPWSAGRVWNRDCERHGALASYLAAYSRGSRKPTERLLPWDAWRDGRPT